MDVRAVTKQKVAAVAGELRALVRKEKTFDEAREDLRTFLDKDSTQKALQYAAMCVPPVHNIVLQVKHLKSDLPQWKKALLTFENVGCYTLLGTLLAWAPPIVAAAGIVGAYSVGSPIEGWMRVRKKENYMIEKCLYEAETVGYIRAEASGERSLFRKKLKYVVYPLDNPRGKEGIVGYRKLVDGEVYDYYPKMIADPDTNTRGGLDLTNWANDIASRKKAKQSYYIAQAQVYGYSAITYTAAYLAGWKGIMFPIINGIAQFFGGHIDPMHVLPPTWPF